MEARIKVSVPAVPVGSVVDVVALGENRAEEVLASLRNGDGHTLSVGKQGQDILLRIRGV